MFLFVAHCENSCFRNQPFQPGRSCCCTQDNMKIPLGLENLRKPPQILLLLVSFISIGKFLIHSSKDREVSVEFFKCKGDWKKDLIIVVANIHPVLISACIEFQVEGNPDAKRLYDDLLSNYNRLIRPVSNNSEKLTVRLGLKLSQLIDVVCSSSLLLKDYPFFIIISLVTVPSIFSLTVVTMCPSFHFHTAELNLRFF